MHFYNGPNSEAYVREDLTIRLLSGTGPEVKNASGTNTINWEGGVVRGVSSGDGDDTITGNNFTNTISGGRGIDTIFSLGGDDYIDVADGEADHVYCGSNIIGGGGERVSPKGRILVRTSRGLEVPASSVPADNIEEQPS